MGNLKDFATSTVLTAPSPATSGTTIVVQSGHGARFPAVPFMVTVHPPSEFPTLDNAEKLEVTSRTSDTLTVLRAQGSTTAKSIEAGWRISNAVFLADIPTVDSTSVDAAGAVMNSDTSTAAMGFVVDEDAMTSNSATKVPTQQSVKAYVDAQTMDESTSEVNTGRLWHDGRPIYRKVLNTTFTASASNSIAINHGISGMTSSFQFISITGGFAIGNTSQQTQQSLYYRELSGNFMCLAGLKATQITVCCSYNWGTSRIIALMEYVK